jgi:hypothetical protein
MKLDHSTSVGLFKVLTAVSSGGVNGGWRVRLTTLQSSESQLSRKCENFEVSTILRVSTAGYRDSFTFFTAMKIKCNVLWNMMSYSLVHRHQNCWGICSCHHVYPEEGSTRFLRIVSEYLPCYRPFSTVSFQVLHIIESYFETDA